jgi:hypothetical protein
MSIEYCVICVACDVNKCKLLPANLPSAPQFAIRNLQFAIRNLQFAIRNLQFAIRNLQFATCTSPLLPLFQIKTNIQRFDRVGEGAD